MILLILFFKKTSYFVIHHIRLMGQGYKKKKGHSNAITVNWQNQVLVISI